MAQNAIIKGKVLDTEGSPIENVTVSNGNTGTITDKSGYYNLKIPSRKNITILFSHISYNNYTKTVRIPKGKTLQFSPKLKIRTEKINEVIIKDERKSAEGITNIKIETISKLPSANDGVESVLKTLPGVNFNNELSTQYNVRGGSFDENLVYVNGIEVYRPFLIRSGQQEGLSFVNPNLTQNVDFSAGGFQAKYGDKLSSVLDITYRKPTQFGLAIEASLLGASVTVEGTSKNNKLKALVGVRYRNNSLIVNSKDINSNYDPNFTDIQTYLSYEVNNKLTFDFLGSYALNNYNFSPISRVTNFGTILNPLALVVHYQGDEKDRYETIFGAIKGIYKATNNLTFSLATSSYNTKEQEHYDILAFYGIGEVNTDFGSDNFGDIDYVQAIGSQLDHARNNLEAQISNINLKATLRKDANLFEFGVKYQYENIKDRIIEWQVIDSAGFSIRPPYLLPKNDEPYTTYSGPITPYKNVRATNNVKINRISGFAQWSKKSSINEHTIWYNIGVRGQQWAVNDGNTNANSHVVVSPRAQFTIKPNWDKDMLFRVSGGYYHQAPFYRELRDSLGVVHPEVKAQQSIHLVLGNDYSFKMWGRSFKLVSEAYYKKLTNVNTFTIDNVQIRYRANNNAIAYATGFDIRLNGEFVPGTESWFSFGYLLTKENLDNRGYISRPTDQRLKFAILFQDYVPVIPNLKMYLNIVYNTGVPGGSPSYANPYLFQNRLKSYFRADLGISYVFVDFQNPAKVKWQEKFKELSAGIELFNMFDVQNTITNTWVKDISSNRSIAIPNFLSGRILNIKVAMRF
ncbi:MAG: carboxypeptidase-like regulatory domain-containing protein [Flavobacteriaceae bacterium]|nr:carboxypeptidase-like regulatory domain-containing protein [Flavobacteriaceae bacterium]